MNISIIYELNENGDVTEKARYSIDTKQALIAYIMQKQNNFNTWEYPTELKGIRESKTKQNHYYFDYNENIVIGSYPKI